MVVVFSTMAIAAFAQQPHGAVQYNSSTSNTIQYSPFSRICNPAGVSIRTCSPEKSASQMLILIGAGLQIQPNGY